MMAAELHPVAIQHLPSFITPPGETDVLMLVMAIVLAISVLAFGLVFLRLHTLPERIAHKSQKFQFEIVAVLGLIALFTHMHIFWVIGLVLALIDLPDIGGWLGRIAGSVEKIAENHSNDDIPEGPASADIKPAAGAAKTVYESQAKTAYENVAAIKRSPAIVPTASELTSAGTRG